MSGTPSFLPRLPPVAVAMCGTDAASMDAGGLPPGGERVRAVIAWLSKAGARAVRVDATMAGIRPRELDRSARRDLAALLRRSELAFAGVDVFLPPEHLVKPDMVDRAVSSILGAIDLAADLSALAAGSVVLRSPVGGGAPTSIGVTLHEKTPADVVHSIADHAAGRSVRIANHVWPISDAVLSAGDEETLAVGLDPATVLAAGGDPVALAAKLGRRVACARLSDVSSTLGAGGRVAPGSGKLDVMAYLVTLATTGYTGHAVLDLQGLKRPAEVIQEVRARAASAI